MSLLEKIAYVNEEIRPKMILITVAWPLFSFVPTIIGAVFALRIKVLSAVYYFSMAVALWLFLFVFKLMILIYRFEDMVKLE